MKTMFKATLMLLAVSIAAPLTPALSQTAPSGESYASTYESIRNEMFRAIQRGNEYLESKQSPEGYWSSKDFPAISALALTAAMRSPEREGEKVLPEHIKKGYDFVMQNVKKDGGIYARGLSTYNTSVCLLALLAAQNSAYTDAILGARKFLIQQQHHFAPDDPYTGGISYGGKDAPHIADLSNTAMAIEAIHFADKIAKDGTHGPQPELNWDAAIKFISRCQDLPQTNDQEWAQTPSANKGGFAYRPTEMKEKPQNTSIKGNTPNKGFQGGGMSPEERAKLIANLTPEQRAAFKAKKESAMSQSAQQHKEEKSKESEHSRVYGSMSYAGLESMIYANLKKDDPRVKAVINWLSNNFTVNENPGMGAEGLFYYYQMMSKAMNAAGLDYLTDSEGQKIDWRTELAHKVITQQSSDGSWVNNNNRWWEADPVLVTAYTVLTLEQIYYSIPQNKKSETK